MGDIGGERVSVQIHKELALRDANEWHAETLASRGRKSELPNTEDVIDCNLGFSVSGPSPANAMRAKSDTFSAQWKMLQCVSKRQLRATKLRYCKC